MIALKRLKMKEDKNFLAGKGDVREARIELEKATEEAFKELNRASRESWIKGKDKVLDSYNPFSPKYHSRLDYWAS